MDEEAQAFAHKAPAQRLRILAAACETEKTAACAMTVFGVSLHEHLDDIAEAIEASR